MSRGRSHNPGKTQIHGRHKPKELAEQLRKSADKKATKNKKQQQSPKNIFLSAACS